MARYRHKDDTDLRWNRLRRKLTRELDTNIQDWREEALNTLLAGAWDEFAAALNRGETLEIESDYKDWVTHALRAVIPVELPK